MATPAGRRRQKNILKIWGMYQTQVKNINGMVNLLERHGRITQEELLQFTTYLLLDDDTLPTYKVSTIQLYIDELMKHILRNKIKCHATSAITLRDVARRHIQGKKSAIHKPLLQF